MRAFLLFISLGSFDGRSLLSSLIQNISSTNEKVCIALVILKKAPEFLSPSLSSVLYPLHPPPSLSLPSPLPPPPPPPQLCSVTLELFYLLVDLNCEDVMIQLVFKYVGALCNYIYMFT